ncbi:helix-turn-helix domain-containing protein [Ancylobacter mangrovi]|uniref:helix-turn-helix domain-containing protein n=1 Tax=Ancylobacter mangrovi TaxID=2972472 RepID=UPI00216142EC|nr:helix-turn-helix transcriptional regulator [Ancylobacter mangrovi]MCS0501607.1 helix-turn-helix domain-containing protein [Ancylobacter mangrovi]
MTPDDFKAWRSIMGYSQTKAAEELGISKSSIELYERGTRRDNGEAVIVPLSIALACTALYHKLKPWPEK